MKIVGFKSTCDLDNWYFNQLLPLSIFKCSICPFSLVLSRLGYRISTDQIYLLFGCFGVIICTMYPNRDKEREQELINEDTE